MLGPQRLPHGYPIDPYGNPVVGTVAFRTTSLDINWFHTWPIIRSILLGCLMMITSAAIIGLDIANLAIEGRKSAPQFGTTPSNVGAGIWSGSISFLASIFIIVIIFVNNKRIAATFALIAITLSFFFTIVLIGLTTNAIQLYKLYDGDGSTNIQYKLIISILSLAAFMIIQCITFFIIYISVFFSSYTRRSMKY